MQVSTLLASLLVVIARTEQHILHVSAYYVPDISSRLVGWRRNSRYLSRYTHGINDSKHDSKLPISELKFSATDIAEGLADESTYYTGDEAKILNAYEEWRNEYGIGDFDSIRYKNFRANYVKLMTANAAELTVARDMGCPDPAPFTLNEYGDFSPEEFNNLQNGANSSNGYVDPQTPGPNVENSLDEYDHIRQKYTEWCYMYQKTYDESRLNIFAANLKAVQNYCRETGNSADLNEYADMSPDEYQTISKSAQIDTSTQSQHNPNLPSTVHQYFSETEVQRIRETYLYWCGFNGKEYSESRLDIFATNFLAFERYCAETGQNAVLNSNADLSPEEYNAMVSSDTGAPSNEVDSSLSSVGQSNYAIDNQDDSTVISSSKNKRESSNLASLLNVSPTVVEQGIRAMYLDWCEYYEKEPSEDGLSHYTMNYILLEKHLWETGEEFYLNEYADLPTEASPQGKETDEKIRLEKEIIQAEEQRFEDERPKEETDRLEQEAKKRMEQARRNEKGRKKVVEKMRKEEEESAKFEEAKQRVEEAQLLEQKQAAAAAQAALVNRKVDAANKLAGIRKSAVTNSNRRPSDLDLEKNRLRQERVRLEEALKFDQACLQEEKEREEEARKALEDADRQINKIIKKDEQDFESENDRLQEERTRLQDALQYEEARLQEETLRENEARRALEEVDCEINKIMQEDEKDFDSEKLRLQQERIKLEQALKTDRALLKEERRLERKARKSLEETNRQIDEFRKETEKDAVENPDPIILPRASYLDAVAKTWVDRTAYLEALQQGKAGALPYNPAYAKTSSERKVEKEQLKIKESESLIDSIWNFMKEYNTNERGTENYSKSLIRQADQLIADSKNDSTVIMGEELRYLKKAVDAMRRRNNDDLAADRARTEANEWEQIQKGLEREAKEAEKRRNHDERIANEARQKARSLKDERREHERRAEEARRRERSLRNKNRETLNKIRSLETTLEVDSASQVQGNPFSFLTSPLQALENNFFESSTENQNQNIFSFFGGRESGLNKNITSSKSMTQPVKIEKKESWIDAVFGFFSGEDNIPGQGTITLEPAKRTSVFDFFISPDSIAPEKEPGRGSITIDDSEESIFSFFAKFGTSKKKEKNIDPVRKQRVMDYESKLRTRQEKLSLLKAGRSRILNEKDKKLSRKEARKLQRELDALATGKLPVASGIPQLAKWIQTPDGRITGWVSDAAGGRYKMGTKITTSRIKQKVVKPGMAITTFSGSKYRLGMTAVRDTTDSISNNRQKNGMRADNSSSSMGSLFGRLFAEENVPSLVEWIQNEDGTITGFVNNKDGFEDGTQITTSPVKKGSSKGMVIQTKGGSKYKLLSEKKSNTVNGPKPPKF